MIIMMISYLFAGTPSTSRGFQAPDKISQAPFILHVKNLKSSTPHTNYTFRIPTNPLPHATWGSREFQWPSIGSQEFQGNPWGSRELQKAPGSSMRLQGVAGRPPGGPGVSLVVTGASNNLHWLPGSKKNLKDPLALLGKQIKKQKSKNLVFDVPKGWFDVQPRAKPVV